MGRGTGEGAGSHAFIYSCTYLLRWVLPSGSDKWVRQVGPSKKSMCELYPSTGDIAMEKQQQNLYLTDLQLGGKVGGSGAYRNNITVIVIYTLYELLFRVKPVGLEDSSDSPRHTASKGSSGARPY